MFYKNIDQFKDDTGYEIDGKWIPRVTSILNIKSKPALYYFYGSLSSFAEGEKIKEISAEEGTLVHETIQDSLIGKDPIIQDSIKPSVDAALTFIKEKNIVIDPNYIEKRVINHKEGYAGTTDALATIDGKYGILDIKTSQAIYRDYNLQTSAYMAALINDVPNLETRWILRVDQHRFCKKCGAKLRTKGGRKKIILPWDDNNYGVRLRSQKCNHEWSPVIGDVELKESKDWKNDYSAFLGAKRLWEWENEKWIKQIK